MKKHYLYRGVSKDSEGDGYVDLRLYNVSKADMVKFLSRMRDPNHTEFLNLFFDRARKVEQPTVSKRK